jgi:hypothetical protein
VHPPSAVVLPWRARRRTTTAAGAAILSVVAAAGGRVPSPQERGRGVGSCATVYLSRGPGSTRQRLNERHNGRRDSPHNTIAAL